MSYQGAFKGVPEFLNAEITDLKMDRLVAKIENSKFGQEHKDEIITTYKQTLSNLKDLWSFLSKNKNEKYIQEIFIVDKPDDLHELRKMSSSLLNLNDHADSQELLAYFNKLNKQISNTSKAIIESLPKELKENFQKLNVKNNNSLPILNDKFNSNKSFEEEDFDETRETVQLLVEENKNLLAALKSANSKCS
jgi:hypothetical protein